MNMIKENTGETNMAFATPLPQATPPVRCSHRATVHGNRVLVAPAAHPALTSWAPKQLEHPLCACYVVFGHTVKKITGCFHRLITVHNAILPQSHHPQNNNPAEGSVDCSKGVLRTEDPAHLPRSHCHVIMSPQQSIQKGHNMDLTGY